MPSDHSNSEFISQHVLGHLFGVLDDDEQEAIELRLEQDAEYAREFAKWRRQLAALESLRPDYVPPSGLADRTCRFIESHKASSRTKCKGMLPIPSPPNWIGRTRWMDVAVVAILLVAASVLLLPAIGHSRFHARVVACQETMRRFGLTMAHYQLQRGGTASRVVANLRNACQPIPGAIAHLRSEVVFSEVSRFFENALSQYGQGPLSAEALQPAMSPSGGVCMVVFAMPCAIDDRLASRRISFVSSSIALDGSGQEHPWSEDGIVVSAGPLPITLTLLNDAATTPSELVSSGPSLHGRNLLFEDNHAAFCASWTEEEAKGSLLSRNVYTGSVFSPNAPVDR